MPESSPNSVSDQKMAEIYSEVKTPFKYGIVIPQPSSDVLVDCPSVFRHQSNWYMIYVCMNKVGYETHLAKSRNLLEWEPLGKILPFANNTWDCWQAGGGVALVDPTWGGSSEIQSFDGKYWLSYLGGALQGYETDPLSIGMAWTDDPSVAKPWNRHPTPVMGPKDPQARAFESTTLYKSYILRDDSKRIGHSFVMYYNGKQVNEQKRSVERIGMAVSDDMIHWQRYGTEPVIDNLKGISGDAQLVRMNDGLWVMFYFGHVWKPAAFDTFACSYDLVNWTKWQGPHLVEPTVQWDQTFAHKPWVIKHEGVVYHFYCSVAKKERHISLATSKWMGK